VAATGREALGKLAAAPSRYDAILMDMQMPEMDGLEATRRIRAQAAHATLPVIAMTAHAMADERERCMAAGMNDHIAKPIEPQALFRTLGHWLNRAPQAPTVADDEHLPEIAGLDAVSGLKRVAGNRRLYLDLLRQFAAKYRQADERIAAALDAGDRPGAERHAHTLKGVAGNLGLLAVLDAATAVEAAIRDGGESAAPLLKLKAELAGAVTTLESALAVPSERPDGAARAPDADTERHARRIGALLAESDGSSLDYLEKHKTTICALFSNGDYAAFERAVNDFEFETAHERLQQAATAHAIDLLANVTGRTA
jgi:CheY-like chemotaxis protein